MRIILKVSCLFFIHYCVLSQNLFEGNEQSYFHSTIPARVGSAQALTDERFAPFYHGVASGDPLSDRVILWTRITVPSNEPISVEWFVATDTAMTMIVRRGIVSTNSEKDFTCKVDADGLVPGTTYYYMFKYDGKNSLIGRTKTTHTDNVSHLRFAFVSCSNYTSGYFNAYRKISERNDLDAIIHLGDYIYEYGNRTSSGTLANVRDYEEDKEIISLAEYRARYALHRLDADVRRLHQQHPFLYVWDDHEAANNAYKDGAQNHTPSSEGEWSVRLAASKKACYEWMPIRENADILYRKFRYGNLAEVFMIDTRMESRDIHVVNLGDNAPQTSKDSLNNPSRKIMSDQQLTWLTDGLKNSTAQWKIIGNQVLFTPISLKNFDTSLFIGNPSLQAITPLIKATLVTGYNADSWGNFPAQRNKLHDFIRDNSINNIVFLTGDIHTTHALDIAFKEEEYNPSLSKGSIGVEFVTPSISSSNFDEIIGNISFLLPFKSVLLQSGVNTMRNNNPHMKAFDITEHGYSILNIMPERTQTDVFHVDTVAFVSEIEKVFSSCYVNNNSKFLTQATVIAAEKEKKDIAAPLLPPQTLVNVTEKPFIIHSAYPVPASDMIYFTLSVNVPAFVSIEIYSAKGEKVKAEYSYKANQGMEIIGLSVNDLTNGMYIAKVTHGTHSYNYSLLIQR